ncbi:cupin-like domain-containing protein [Nostoc sp. FACHB-152]|uniref:cupin-like domain-containing protein n=1 Tax=unclassified Nostoc TaxID=2593658 RepID=UPI00168377E4|nr:MULTISPECIES: cupin-like domain-containing protein [unclassified Nostoc]MBD2451883.1 cupin-like domain-containing protein [Nostoc sp. FACHB-152]MBD2472530.1 cupin-like domain-containing protein [Nostoc sp. FACHB-145]
MVLNNIERIKAPSKDMFYREYILPQRPVIITNLFDSSSLCQMDTLEKARTELTDIQVQVCPNYIANLLNATSADVPRMMNLCEYFDFLQAQPTSLDICVEYPTPQNLLELLPLNLYQDLSDESDLYSNMFVAGSNNYAHLHYDADQRNVLMFQVFGTKRFILIHPSETHKLDAIDQPNLCRTSGLFLENMSEAEKTDFINYTNAFDVVLYPGETIFMPMMIWHYIEYLEPAMSIAYRLGRNQYNRRLAQLFPAPSVDVQSLSLLLMDETVARSHHTGWLNKLENISSSLHGSESDRLAALNYLCLKIRGQYLGFEPIKSMRELTRRQTILEQATLYS